MIDITYTVIALIIVKCTVASEFRNWGMFQIPALESHQIFKSSAFTMA